VIELADPGGGALLAPTIAALVGALFGALFSRGIPAGWSAPRLRITRIDGHASFCRVHVDNAGRTAAQGTAARLTCRGVGRDDVIDLRHEPWVPPEKRAEREPWFRSREAFRRRASVAEAPQDMGGAIHWATVGNPSSLVIRPQMPEALNLAYFDGAQLRVASEDPYEARTILRVKGGADYVFDLVVSAENARPARCTLTLTVERDEILVTGHARRRRLGPVTLARPDDA
jgi:hypothetical protein